MARPISSPNEQVSTVRNLKVLVVLLVISNILVGVLGVYLLRLVDRRYSELIDHTAPVLNDLQTLTAKSTSAMRATNPKFFQAPVAELGSAIQHGRSELDAERSLRKALLGAEWLPSTSAKRKEFREAGDAFTKLGGQVLDLLAGGQTSAATRLREETLRPVFERYQDAVTRIADDLLSEIKVTNDNFTSNTSSFSKIVISVASWPVILLIALLVLTAVFVVAMMVAFRGKDLADTP